MMLGPMGIGGIEGGLAGVEIDVGGVEPLGALEDLPGEVEDDEDGDADVIGDEVVDVEGGTEDVEAVEDDDEGEEDEGGPGGVGLEGRLEDQRVAVDALRLERLVELDVRDADRAPREERRDRRQVLEPGEDHVRPRRAGHVRQERDGGRDADAPVRDTTAEEKNGHQSGRFVPWGMVGGKLGRGMERKGGGGGTLTLWGT